jgi:hypothetical protein
MLKVFTDFNARTKDGLCWILKYNEDDLSSQVSQLNLKPGDKVILYQDEGDFEVVATLDFRWVDFLGREAWVAIPDWITIVRKN